MTKEVVPLLGYGAQLFDPQGEWEPALVESLEFSGTEVQSLDVTTSRSRGADGKPVRKKRAGRLRDNGTLTVRFEADPLRQPRIGGDTRPMRIEIYGNEECTDVVATYEFTGFVKSVDRALPFDDRLTGTAVIEIEDLVFAAATPPKEK